MVDRETLIRGAQIELARREFFFYCHLKAPDFYKEDRRYLVDLCNEFQDFIQSDDEVMVVNEPPRHGKSRTAGLLVEWVLGNDRTQKIKMCIRDRCMAGRLLMRSATGTSCRLRWQRWRNA